MCNIDVKHVRHVFFECQFASNCWDCAECAFDTTELKVVSTWVLQMLGSESEERLEKLVKFMGDMVG